MVRGSAAKFSMLRANEPRVCAGSTHPALRQGGQPTLADMARRTRTMPPRIAHGAALVAVAGTLFLSGCVAESSNEGGSDGVGGGTGGDPQSTETPPTDTQQQPTTSTPPPPPEYVPDGTAADNLPYFEHLLTEYAESEGAALEGRPIVDVVIAGGFARDDMQVSFDHSKTNLPADSIYVSVRISDSCLLGQVVNDFSVHAIVQPAVGPEDNLCLIGETRPIDW